MDIKEKMDALIKALEAGTVPDAPVAAKLTVDSLKGILESLVSPFVRAALEPVHKATIAALDTNDPTGCVYLSARVGLANLGRAIKELPFILDTINRNWGLRGHLAHLGAIVLVGTEELAVFIFPHVPLKDREAVTAYIKLSGWGGVEGELGPKKLYL